MPMSPEFLPELAMLIAGVILGAVAIHRLTTRAWRHALGFGAAGAALVALAFVSGNSGRVHPPYSESLHPHQTTTHRALLPERRTEPGEPEPGAPPTATLVLGGVPVKVVASDRYVLSVHDEEFLTLDQRPPGLVVTCDVAGVQSSPVPGTRLDATIRENAVWECAPGVRPARPDAHTILVKDEGKDVLKIRYASPRRIEVTGQFFLSEGVKPGVITMMNGLDWQGATIGTGRGIDLRPQGKGRIDFQRSGMIRVVPESRRQASEARPGAAAHARNKNEQSSRLAISAAVFASTGPRLPR